MLHIPQRGLDGGGVHGVGGLDGLQSHIVCVIAHGGHRGDGVVSAVGLQSAGGGVDVLLDARVKLGVAALLIEGGHIQLHVGALGGLQHHVVVQGVGAQEGDVDAQRGGLGNDLGGVGDGDWGEDDVGPLGLGLVQIGVEVGVVGGEGVLDDFAAGGGEGLLEEVDQALVILIARLAQQIGGLGLELLHGEVGQDGALEGVQEADAEIVVIAGGDHGVGAGDADGRQPRVAEGGAGGDGHAGAVGAQHQRNALAHQLGGGGQGLVSGGAVVGVDQLDLILLAAHSDGGGLRVGVLHAQHLLLAAGGGVAGGGLEHADLEDIVPGDSRGGDGGTAAGGGIAAAGTGAGTAGQQAQHHRGGEHAGKKLFHLRYSFFQLDSSDSPH